MRVAIIGSRSIRLNWEIDILQYLPEQTSEIVSGGASGADRIAERIAELINVPMTVFRPNYASAGGAFRKAPLERNLEIIRYSDYVIALWDGISRGTSHVIKSCASELTPFQVIICKDGQVERSIFGSDFLVEFSDGYDI